MEQRRLLLAIFLTFLVLMGYQWLLPQPPTPQDATNPAASTPAPSQSAPAPAEVAAPPPALPPVEALVADAAERTVTVENGLVRAAFSNRGATLTNWWLSQYQDNAGQPLDLVPQDVPATTPKPFSLKLDDAAQSARVNNALYQVIPSDLDARTTPVSLTFEYQDAAGLRVRKQFRFEPNSYVVTVSATVMDGDRVLNPAIEWGPGLGDVMAGGGRYARLAEGIYSIAGKVQRPAADSMAATPRYEGDFEFAGVDTHYFISAAVRPGTAVIELHPLSVAVANATPPVARDFVAYAIRYAQPPASTRFYVGPKELQALKAVDPLMVPAIWFGIFSFLSVPLLSALNWVNGFVGNYGWSIIVLTIIINAAMFPLRHKSFVSMRKMQEIQPLVKAIQDRYTKLKVTDPAKQKMNTELMELYRQKGVNPAGGCIPMLLTMPVLFAFYGLLSESIELRGAPFIFWLKDLSLADPYYVTPILMGLSQVVQQRMTPMTGVDPVQQKMMMFMPVVFTFLFLTSPSGLALYWFASNVLVIGQQKLTNYLIGPPVIRAPRSPAERRMKKVGEGKTENVEAETKNEKPEAGQ